MLLDLYVCFGGNASKNIHKAVPIHAGDNSHEEKKKGKNNFLMSPIIKTIHQNLLPEDIESISISTEREHGNVNHASWSFLETM